MSGPTTPPAGTGTGKVPSPPSRGAKPLPCLAPIGQRLCILARAHRGTHLPAAKWAHTDISDSNPSVRSSK